MIKEEIKKWLETHKGYLKKSPYTLANRLNIENIDLCRQCLKEVKNKFNSLNENKNFKKDIIKNKDIFRNAFINKENTNKLFTVIKENKQGKNVLVIGDLHLPFSLEGYLEYCIEQYKTYNCDEVVFIGDIIDNHASSYHETDPDGHSAGEELKMAISQVKNWYKAFPKATIIIGNHDRIIMRKAYSSGLSKLWIKDYAEVLGTPGWNFTESIEIDDVLYIHGEGGTARQRVRRDLQSIVQGHLHTQCYTEWIVGSKFKLFGMQVGCGIDHKTYAMTYGKENAKPAIGCGIILQGKVAINCMMGL